MSHATTQHDTDTLTHAELAQFTGDLQRFRHPLNPKVAVLSAGFSPQ